MIAATRTLYIRTTGATAPTEVSISIDVPVMDRSAWRCDLRIGWPDGEKAGYGMGFDAVQALYSALRFVAIQLYSSPYHQSRSLYFGTPGDGYGFPLPFDSRDLAIGLDKSL
jgi:hypothetical protein